MQETRVRSLSQENPLEKEMAVATQSSILAWEIAWTEKLGRLQSMGPQKSQIQLTDWTATPCCVEAKVPSTHLWCLCREEHDGFKNFRVPKSIAS